MGPPVTLQWPVQGDEPATSCMSEDRGFRSPWHTAHTCRLTAPGGASHPVPDQPHRTSWRRDALTPERPHHTMAVVCLDQGRLTPQVQLLALSWVRCPGEEGRTEPSLPAELHAGLPGERAQEEA